MSRTREAITYDLGEWKYEQIGKLLIIHKKARRARRKQRE